MVYLVSFYPTKWLRNFAGAPIFHPTKWLRNFSGAPNFSPQKLTMFLFGGPDLCFAGVSRFFHPKNSRCSFSGAPISVSLVYLVPLARFRYCASPEASIMRLKAAAKMGATASAPTQHFLPCHRLFPLYFKPCRSRYHRVIIA